MEALVRRYEACTIGLDVLLLARDWLKAGEAAKASPIMLQATADQLATVILPRFEPVGSWLPLSPSFISLGWKFSTQSFLLPETGIRSYCSCC